MTNDQFTENDADKLRPGPRRRERLMELDEDAADGLKSVQKRESAVLEVGRKTSGFLVCFCAGAIGGLVGGSGTCLFFRPNPWETVLVLCAVGVTLGVPPGLVAGLLQWIITKVSHQVTTHIACVLLASGVFFASAVIAGCATTYLMLLSYASC